jgi:hypothetical protein
MKATKVRGQSRKDRGHSRAEAVLAQKAAPQVQDLIVAARLNLINEEIWDLEGLFSDYEGVFVMKGSVYRWTDEVYYHIDVGEAQPI